MVRFTFTYTGIRVRDMDRSIDFYTRLLGMTLTIPPPDPAGPGEVAWLRSRRGGPTLELIWYAPTSKWATRYIPGEGLDHLAFRTDDLAAALRLLRKEGHPVVAGPIRGRNSDWAYVEDPDRNWIEVWGPRRKVR